MKWERAASDVSMFVDVEDCGWKEKDTLLLKGSECHWLPQQ